MKNLLMAVVTGCALMLVGCGADVCSLKSKCSAQMQASTAQVETCKTESASSAKCVMQYTALVNCIAAKEVCAADNTTDAAASLAACSTESNAYSTCKM